jgi:hypothetical protein
VTTARIRIRSLRIFAPAALAAAASLVGSAPASVAADATTMATTLSGLPAQPFSERSVSVGEHGIGIRFRAPASRTLTTAYTYWRRPDVGCRIALHADAAGSPGPLLAAADVGGGEAGWVATALPAALAEGAHYHLVAACPDGRRGRLRYVLDAHGSGASDVWNLADLRRPRSRLQREEVAPLFALVFDDGSWWGQPYRGAGRRRRVRICGASQVRQRLVTRTPMTVRGIALDPGRHTGDRALEFSLVAADGSPVMAGALRPARRGGRRPVLQAASVAPTTLAAGTPYLLTLRARAGGGCHRPRTLETDLPLGPPLAGTTAVDLETTDDGGTRWDRTSGTDSLAVTLHVGALGGAIGRPPATCGDGALDDGEQCDGAADASCPGACTAACTCTTPPRAYRSIYASGYMGAYDPATVPVWPKRLGLVLNGVDVQGPLVRKAKETAVAAGNADARFIFYFSLTDMDSGCDCYDQDFYEHFRDAHPEWILRSAGGGTVSTNNGIGRLFATDIGNLAYVEAWADWALASAERYGFDGVFADNVFRGYFDTWSARPINPRTGAPYTTAEYRRDMLAALTYLRSRFEAKGKLLIGNHVGSWDTPVFSDPVIQEEVKTMHGTEIEDCVYTFGGSPHPESKWLAQLAYLDFANRHGTRTICNGYAGSIGKPERRTYMLASYLLTKEGFSSLSELNKLSQWWSELEIDLGAPRGRFTCLDPANGLAPAASCPASGKIYQREWAKGRVLVNPTDSRTVAVPLGGTFLRGGSAVTSVTLRPHSGVVLVRP